VCVEHLNKHRTIQLSISSAKLQIRTLFIVSTCTSKHRQSCKLTCVSILAMYREMKLKVGHIGGGGGGGLGLNMAVDVTLKMR